jgi:hypothetical protein
VPAAIRQIGSTQSTAPTTNQVTLTGVLSGSTIVAWGTNVTTAPTFSDSANPAYTITDSITASGYGLAQAYVANSAAGTIVVSCVCNNNFNSLVAAEISGVTTSPLDGHTSNESTQSAGFTIGPPSPNNSNAPCLIISYSLGRSNLAPTAGSGYTSAGTFVNFSSGNIANVESTLLSSGSSSAVPWTATSNQIYDSFIIILDQAGGASFVGEDDDGPPIAYSFASDLGLYLPRGSVDELPIAGATLAAEEASGPLIWMPVDYGSVPSPSADELPSYPLEESSLTIRPSDDVSAPARQVNSDDVSGTLFAALEGEGSTFLPPQTIDAITLPEPCEDHFSGFRGLEESSLAVSPPVIDPPPLDPSPEDQFNAFVSPLEEASPPPAVPASPDPPFLPEPGDDFPPPAASTLAVEEWSPPVPAQPVVEVPPILSQEDTVHTSVASIAAEEQGAVLTLADAWQGAPYASQEELPAQAALDDASRPYSFAQDPQPANMFSPGEDVLGQIALEEASPNLVSPSDASPTSYFSTGNDERLQTALADESGYIWPQSSVEVPPYPASREDWMASPPSPFGLDDAQSAILWPQDLDQWRSIVASVDDEFFKLVVAGINLPGAICSTMPSISVTCATVPPVSVTCQTVGIAPAP